MRLNRRVPVGTHGGVRGRLSIHESLLLDLLLNQQFNDNFKKQGYHDINDKNKE